MAKRKTATERRSDEGTRHVPEARATDAQRIDPPASGEPLTAEARAESPVSPQTRAKGKGSRTGTATAAANAAASHGAAAVGDSGSAGPSEAKQELCSTTPTPITDAKVKSPLLPYQKAWINDESPRKLGDKSRRTGWTYAEAYDAVSRRYRRTQPRNADYWFSSADDSAAMEFIDYCAFWAKDLFAAIADRFTESIEDAETKRVATAYCLRCPNDHKIVAMTSNPRRFRSKGGDVTLDEFAFHDDQRGMYTAASPVTTWGGRMAVFSTPNGEGTEYDRMVKGSRRVLEALGIDPNQSRSKAELCSTGWEALQAKAREIRVTPVFSYHRVTIVDAIEQGIVETINRTRGTKWTREAFLLDCREKSLDEESFRQEYMCEPGADHRAWLSMALIESGEHMDAAQPDKGLVGYEGGPCYVGVDFGRDRDLTVIWVLEQVGDVLWTRQIRILENKPTPIQEQELASILRSVKFVACEMDCTGNGLGLYEYTRKAFGSRIHGVQFGSSVESIVDPSEKKIPVTLSMATALKDRFDDRLIRIPWNNARIKDGLHKPKKVATATGRITFHAARDKNGHADEFWALALAVAGATVRTTGGLMLV